MTEREKLFNLATHSNNPAWRWFPNNAEMLRFVDYLLANGVTVQKWIPVTERLPQESGEYLVYCGEYDGICILSYVFLKTKGRWETKWREVTHWMPLPEPPKEEA